jgi:hypothetical protein
MQLPRIQGEIKCGHANDAATQTHTNTKSQADQSHYIYVTDAQCYRAYTVPSPGQGSNNGMVRTLLYGTHHIPHSIHNHIRTNHTTHRKSRMAESNDATKTT